MSTETVIGMDLAEGDDFSCYTIGRRCPDGTMRIIECGRMQRRLVRSAKRVRKLRKRGESVGWDLTVGAWTWHMRRPYPRVTS